MAENKDFNLERGPEEKSSTEITEIRNSVDNALVKVSGSETVDGSTDYKKMAEELGVLLEGMKKLKEYNEFLQAELKTLSDEMENLSDEKFEERISKIEEAGITCKKVFDDLANEFEKKYNVSGFLKNKVEELKGLVSGESNLENGAVGTIKAYEDAVQNILNIVYQEEQKKEDINKIDTEDEWKTSKESLKPVQADEVEDMKNKAVEAKENGDKAIEELKVGYTKNEKLVDEVEKALNEVPLNPNDGEQVKIVEELKLEIQNYRDTSDARNAKVEDLERRNGDTHIEDAKGLLEIAQSELKSAFEAKDAEFGSDLNEAESKALQQARDNLKAAEDMLNELNEIAKNRKEAVTQVKDKYDLLDSYTKAGSIMKEHEYNEVQKALDLSEETNKYEEGNVKVEGKESDLDSLMQLKTEEDEITEGENPTPQRQKIVSEYKSILTELDGAISSIQLVIDDLKKDNSMKNATDIWSGKKEQIASLIEAYESRLEEMEKRRQRIANLSEQLEYDAYIMDETVKGSSAKVREKQEFANAVDLNALVNNPDVLKKSEYEIITADNLSEIFEVVENYENKVNVDFGRYSKLGLSPDDNASRLIMTLWEVKRAGVQCDSDLDDFFNLSNNINGSFPDIKELLEGKVDSDVIVKIKDVIKKLAETSN